MKKKFLQSFFLQLIYKGIFQWFLKVFMGMRFGDNSFLKDENQFIIIANHNSHWDTISLLASLPRKMLWKVKPVAAEDYFGKTKLRASISNYLINTLLIQRKRTRDEKGNPIKKMLDALDEGYSLIIFPEGTRGENDHMQEIKPGIAHILLSRPCLKYIPVYLQGMRNIFPKGDSPYRAINYGSLTWAQSNDIDQIMKQIKADFEALQTAYQLPKES